MENFSELEKVRKEEDEQILDVESHRDKSKKSSDVILSNYHEEGRTQFW